MDFKPFKKIKCLKKCFISTFIAPCLQSPFISKDFNSFKDLAILSLFNENNKFNLRPIPSFLFIFTTVKSS